MDRSDILKSLFNHNGVGLEIGPSYNPLIRKSDGFNVQTVDYASRSALIEKYINDPNAPVENIEEVDFVTEGRPLLDIIPYRRHYDYIIASHVIEHTADLIDFLESCRQFLTKTGTLVLAVPDKRFCFDLFQPITTAGQVIQENLDRRSKPSVGAIFDSVAYDMLRNGKIGWEPNDASTPHFHSSLDHACAVLEEVKNDPKYTDVHVWRFVPSSFRLLINDLHRTGLIGLREAGFVPVVGHEFYITLSEAGTGPGMGRHDLAIETMRELAEIPLPPALTPAQRVARILRNRLGDELASVLSDLGAADFEELKIELNNP